VPVNLEGLVLGGWPGQVLDTLALFLREVDDDRRSYFQREVNRIFLEEGVPWRLADGEFFRVDSEFLAIEVQRTEELLHAQGFNGVLAELREARNDLSSGYYRGAIRSACNAFESAMKSVLGADTGTASELIRRMTEEGYFDDLPEDVRAGFGEQVLMALPFLGNRLGRHGQGREVVDVPREYAELAVGLAGQFINFCINKALARREPPPMFVPNPLPGEAEEPSEPVV
jgi:HEPN domain-containing protein